MTGAVFHREASFLGRRNLKLFHTQYKEFKDIDLPGTYFLIYFERHAASAFYELKLRQPHCPSQQSHRIFSAYDKRGQKKEAQASSCFTQNLCLGSRHTFPADFTSLEALSPGFGLLQRASSRCTPLDKENRKRATRTNRVHFTRTIARDTCKGAPRPNWRYHQRYGCDCSH